MRGYFLLYFLFLSGTILANDDIIFEGHYENTSFEKFTEDVNHKTGAHFFYKHEDIQNISITASGDSLNLRSILNHYFKNTDLVFYIDEYRHVFVTRGKNFVAFLPEFKTNSENDETGDQYISTDKDITDLEKKYINGFKKGNVTTIVIGEKTALNKGKTIVVNGKIKDIESGEALIGATVYIEELKKGFATDVNGRCYMSLDRGTYTAVFNCLGMEETRCMLEVYSGGQFTFEMKRKLIPIDEATITSDKFHNVRSSQMGIEHFTLKTIKEIPVVLGERDLLKVAQMLPGVQNVGEGSSGFNVRGSSADQNMFFINKMPVYNTSHMLGFFSAFNPDIVNDFTLYKSNIPAKYGGRLSSFFDLTSPEGNKKKFFAKGGLSPVTWHISVEGPIVKERCSFIFTARSTYSDWILSKVNYARLRNSKSAFYDLAANLTFEPDSKNSILLFGYMSHDRFSLGPTNHYRYGNYGGSVSWNHEFSSNLSSDFTLVTSTYGFNAIDSTVQMDAYTQQYSINHNELRSDLIWTPIANHLVTLGVNNIYYNLNRGNVDTIGNNSLRLPVELGIDKGIESALYISDKFQITPKLTVSLGLRYSLYNYLGTKANYTYLNDNPRETKYITDTLSNKVKTYSGPEFRGSMNLSTGQFSSVKFSYNRTRQYLFLLSNTIALSPVDQWKLCDYHILPPLSDQFSLGYYKDFAGKKISLSTELYTKKVKNIIEYKDGASFISNPAVEQEILQGKQTAYGLELMAKKNSGRITGWISYCYSHSEILVTGKNNWEKINDGLTFPSNYDKPHAINMVINWRIRRQLSIAGNVVYNTGRPITYPVAIYKLDEREQVLFSTRNKYRIPDYFRMDLSVNLEGNLKAKKIAHSSWMLNVYNLTGRDNAYSVFFKSDEGKIKGYKMSIFSIPVFTLSWNIKLGNYANE